MDRPRGHKSCLTIYDCGLSARARRVLERADLLLLRQVQASSDLALERLPGVGKKVLAEVRGILPYRPAT